MTKLKIMILVFVIVNSAHAGGGLSFRPDLPPGRPGFPIVRPSPVVRPPPPSRPDQPQRPQPLRDRVKELRPHPHQGRQLRRGNENSQRPGRMGVGRPMGAGNGCPQDTMRVVFAPDNLSFTIIFDKFVAEVNSQQIRRDNMNCDLIVPIDLPENQRMEITRVDIRGFVNLPENARASLNSTFNFMGDRGGGGNMSLNYSFTGPLVDNYELSSEALNDENNNPTGEVSPCGGKVNLAIRNRVLLTTRRPGDAAMVTVDSIDGAGHAIYYVNWRSCNP